MKAPLFLRIGAVLGLITAIPTFVCGSAQTPNPGLRYYYPAPEAPVVDVEADVVVYGGTSGGVVAAIQALRMGKTVALVVFRRHLGGMTSGGLTLTDGVDATVQGGITREFFNRTGNTRFLPSAALSAFEAMAAQPIPGDPGAAPVPVYYEQRLAWVEKVGTRLVAMHMENGSVFRGKAFIDCTYEGDLMAAAGVSYTYGRESSAQYGESRAGKRNPQNIPGVNAYVEEGNPSSGLIYNLMDEPQGTTGEGDSHIQAYNFRMFTVRDSDPQARRPLFPPAEYDPSRFELLYRYHRGGGTTTMRIANDVNNHQFFHKGVASDHIGGNRWPDGEGGWIPWPEADYETREKIFQSHVSWQLGMLWYLRNDARYRALASDPTLSSAIRANIQTLLEAIDELGFPLHEYPETGGWPHELYVREARRMVSDLVVTQAHYDRDIIVDDPVGLANYVADSHHVRRIAGPTGLARSEGDTGGGIVAPWRIPYRALVPRRTECTNLLVPWALSATHVAFGSIRMEPCFMVLSQSAATAACLALDEGLAVQDLPYARLRLHLLADGQILGEVLPTSLSDIVDNSDATGFSTVGNWIAATSTSGFWGPNYLHDDSGPAGKAAIYQPNIAFAGPHEVFLRWTSHANRASNVPVDVHHALGTTTVQVDQRSGGGAWNSIGHFEFAEGSEGRVVIRNDGANGYVIADAVRFVPDDRPADPNMVVHVLAPDPWAKEASGAPARIQFLRESGSLLDQLALQIEVGGTAVEGVHFLPLARTVIIPANRRSVSLPVIPVPDSLAQGTRRVEITLLPDRFYTVGANASATAFILDKPYDDWRYRQFAHLGDPNAPEFGPLSDPSGSGRPNILAFLLGQDPMDPVARPSITISASSGQVHLLHPRAGVARDLAYRILYADSLTGNSWQPLPVEPATVHYDPESGDRVLQRTWPIESAQPLFFRLEVPQ